jgi:hypothetical protein
MEWFHLAQDSIPWRTFVNRINALSSPIKGREFLDHLSAYRVKLLEATCHLSQELPKY